MRSILLLCLISGVATATGTVASEQGLKIVTRQTDPASERNTTTYIRRDRVLAKAISAEGRGPLITVSLQLKNNSSGAAHVEMFSVMADVLPVPVS